MLMAYVYRAFIVTCLKTHSDVIVKQCGNSAGLCNMTLPRPPNARRGCCPVCPRVTTVERGVRFRGCASQACVLRCRTLCGFCGLNRYLKSWVTCACGSDAVLASETSSFIMLRSGGYAIKGYNPKQLKFMNGSIQKCEANGAGAVNQTKKRHGCARQHRSPTMIRQTGITC